MFAAKSIRPFHIQIDATSGEVSHLANLRQAPNNSENPNHQGSPEMTHFPPALMKQIRARFAQVDRDPVVGERVFFENAGGALTLNSVVETSKDYAAIPDNQGRGNDMSKALVETIAKARSDMRILMNASGGQVFVGESGTELLFRLISTACLGAAEGGEVLGSTFEHPASRSAAIRWAGIARATYVSIPHKDETGMVTADDYALHVTKNTRVATILHTSPVTGMGVDVAAIVKEIRAVSPDCFIIVDGIQHAAHGRIDVDSYDIDGYVISPYKMFSRHGYGFAWASDRLSALPHDNLIDGPDGQWELGTRDTGSYATLSDVVSHMDWLGGEVSNEADPRARIEAAGHAIHAHEHALTQAMMFGAGNQKGLTELSGLTILGGQDNPAREGLVSFYSETVSSADIVAKLDAAGIRVHIRRADHYSGTILRPLGREDCVRVSMCHYNTEQEVAQFLAAMNSITA
jgi:selenocysteine lyase/cysteine desulfurase